MVSGSIDMFWAQWGYHYTSLKASKFLSETLIGRLAGKAFMG